MGLIFWAIFLLILFPAKGLTAEPLNLKKAKELALAHNPTLKAAISQEEAARAGITRARSAFFPQLDIREIYQRSDSPVYVFSNKLAQQYFQARDFDLDRLNHPSALTNLKTEISVTQPIFNRGQEIVGYRKAKIAAEMARLWKEAVRQRVLYEAEAAYLRLLLARERVDVVEKAVETARKNLKVVSARVSQGLALRSDLLQARVFLATQERDLLAAQNDVQVARSRLNVVLGLPLETTWLPQKVSLAFRKVEPLAFWITKALAHRPDLLAEQARLRLAEEDVRGAKLNFGPAVNLRGVYEYNSEGIGGVQGDAFTIWAQVDLNLFRGFGDKARLAEARAKELAQTSKLRAYEAEVKHQVEKAYLNLLTARKQVEVTEAAVAEAEEGLRLVERRYREGLTIIVELLDAQTALKKAQLQHLEALYNYRLALTELYFRAGILSGGEK
ncbi:MAG: TolC family protein [Thermodesulfobacteria bacterium]|nr:TolC family protein [Thermodesulfobacteriota bacterium]